MGTRDQIGAKLMVNAPFSETVFLRVSALANRQDGYIRLLNYPGRQLGDDNTLVGRVQLRWLATPDLKLPSWRGWWSCVRLPWLEPP